MVRDWFELRKQKYCKNVPTVIQTLLATLKEKKLLLIVYFLFLRGLYKLSIKTNLVSGVWPVILCFLHFFSLHFPVSKLAGLEQPPRLWKVRRGPSVGFPNIVPTLNDLLDYTWSRIRPRPSSGSTWLRTSRRGEVCKQKAAMDIWVTCYRNTQVCCSGVSPAGCSIVPETGRESYLLPVRQLRVSARSGGVTCGSIRGGAWQPPGGPSKQARKEKQQRMKKKNHLVHLHVTP